MPQVCRPVGAVIAMTALLCATGGARAANAESDLEQRIARATAGEQSPLLLQLAHEREPFDVNRALDAARKARSAATKPVDELRAAAEISSLLRLRGDYAEAMATARDGLARAEELGDTDLRAQFLYAVARTHWSLADYPGSVTAFIDTIRLAEQAGDRGLLCDAHLGISTIYNEIHQSEQARPHLEQARLIAESLHDPQRLGDYYKIYGNALVGINDLAGARAAHERSKQIFEQAGYERGVADALQNLAALAETAHDLTTAVANCERAVAIYQRLGLKRHLLNAQRELGVALIKQGRPKDAIRPLQSSRALATELGGPAAVANTDRVLSLAYEALGDYRAALAAQRNLQTELDTVLGEKSRQQITELNARYNAERRQHEIALLRRDQELQTAELERSRTMRYALAAALLLGLVTLGATISRQRLKLRAERRIREEADAAREVAEEADRIKTRFLGIASHDIRAPLGNILNLAGTVRSKAAGDEALSEDCDLIGAEAQRVICLVEDLLTTAALESGRLELRHASIDLGEITSDAVESLRWQAHAKRQSIEFSPPPAGTALLNGDPARLHQVVANLLSNAIKFSPPGKAVAVALTRFDGVVSLTVRDQGAGIAAKDMTRLFTPFERLATHPTAGESSHGLGLSIAQQIVRLHGGQIRTESQPGEGSTFIVELPVGGTPPVPPTAPPPA
jgi:signal transduction histidine kinase